MQIEVFTIADAATVDRGKLNLLGSFDHLLARNFPARHNECVIVCKLRLGHEDSESEHNLKIRIIDPDGRDVIEPAKSTFHPKIDFGGSGHHTHLWSIRAFPLPKPGTFYIDALVDEKLIARTPLFVNQYQPGPN
ncbi:MAG: hypothetical protein EA353_03515 [Puniceicoccaceae bacterium]|nr:MAG: hypothetical protein EA353_03515 [Puniceicoccaceae bacterium]